MRMAPASASPRRATTIGIACCVASRSAACTTSPVLSRGSIPRSLPPKLRAGILAARSNLLDGREQPAPTRAACEGPHLAGFDRVLRIAAGDDLALARIATAADGVVACAPMHQRGRIVHTGFIPGLAHFAFDQLDILDLVGDALALILGELLREIGQHLGRRVLAQRAKVAIAPGLLHAFESG